MRTRKYKRLKKEIKRRGKRRSRRRIRRLKNNNNNNKKKKKKKEEEEDIEVLLFVSTFCPVQKQIYCMKEKIKMTQCYFL